MLSLAECPIQTVPEPGGGEGGSTSSSLPTWLQSLNVSITRLNSWAEVDKISQFPGLSDLRIQVPNCNENLNYVFLFWELRSLSPNFHIHMSASYLYIPTTDRHISCSRIGRSIMGIHISLTDTWMWKLGLWPRRRADHRQNAPPTPASPPPLRLTPPPVPYILRDRGEARRSWKNPKWSA